MAGNKLRFLRHGLLLLKRFGTLWFDEQLLNDYGLNYNKKVAGYTSVSHMQ